MSVNEVRVQPIIRAYLYDGTNGQEILDLLGPQRLALDEDGALCIKMPFSLEPIPVGNYVTVTAGITPGTSYGAVDSFDVLPG